MSFSKALLGLAATTVFSSLALAQNQTLSCIAQPVDTPALRDNGVTERVGDLKIVCTGGTPTPATVTANGVTTPVAVPQFNLQIFTSPAVNITSRIISNPGGDVSEALMLIDEPAPGTQLLCGSTNAPTTNLGAGTCPIQGQIGGTGVGTYDGSPAGTAAGGSAGFGRPNAFVGRRSGDNSIVWNGIPFDPPGSGAPRVIRLTNIRLNASQLNNVRGGATSVNIIISTTSSGSGNSIQVPIGNPAPTVGIAQTPLDFSATNGTFLQCSSQNFGALGVNLTAVGTDAAAGTIGVAFTERFASALRRRSAANPPLGSVAPPAPISSNNLTNSQLFETESGFYNGGGGNSWNLASLGFAISADATKIGLADTGTRIMARFKNLPSGATLYAANHVALTQVGAATTVLSTGDLHATTADANGAGVFSGAAATGFSAITAVSGTGNVVYEVIDTTTNVTESAKVQLALAYAANTSNNLPTLGSATADGQLAPLSTSAVASGTATIPRFVEDTTNNGKALFTINACRSNLLFPFITNGGGYETGMAIVNTTKDPWGTQSQTGNCTVVFYGKSGTSDVCLTQQSNKSITGGQFLAWTLGGGGDVPATPNFTGYAIAQCNFQYGHGFAFITDTRVEKVAHGYLALVLDDPIGTLPSQFTRGKRTGSTSEVLGN